MRPVQIMAAELTKPYPVHRPRAARCGSPLPSALAFPEKLKISAPRKGQRKSNKGRREKERRKHLLVPQHLTHPPQYPRCPSTHLRKVKNTSLSSAPISASLCLLSSSLSSRSLSSRSDASLWASSSSSSGFGALRPTCVEARKSRIARLHRGSAKRSRIFQRLFHLPISFLTVLHIIFYYIFHSEQFFRRCSLV